ncbi:SGNH hydrolase-type esterase domain-containing protein [Tricladium varicosporioides]|nr:SGNH hydrolase-type esterase domain-containing protein [Hymenoscyphus varicosporioides]
MSYFINLLTMLAWFFFLNGCALAASVNSTSIPFRIMSVGASVTFGVGSTTGNSYRKDLEDLITADGGMVQYVGTKKNGNFADNAVEATSGFVIAQIGAATRAAAPKFKPNLVLIDAGTNNCNGGGTIPDAGANVTSLINDIYRLSPGATVILTTVLVNSVAAQDACRVDINKQYTTLASTLQATGAKLVLVDMRGPAGPLVTDLADGRHPNDVGYQKMANVWFQGVQQVISKGFLTQASTNITASASAASKPAKVTASIASSSGQAMAASATATSTDASTASSSPGVFKSTSAGRRLDGSMNVTALWVAMLSVLFCNYSDLEGFI